MSALERMVADRFQYYDRTTQKEAAAELAAMREAIEATKTPCTWAEQDEEESNSWETTCGNMFSFFEGTPKENDVKFCPFCGHPVTEKAYEPLNWDDEE